MPARKIAADFRASASFSKDNEVQLFRKFANAIVANTRSVFIDETHGATKCNVSFTLTSGSSTRCEIADLLILSRSKNASYLRATFWQAKKQRKSKWVALGSNDKHVDFTGQFNQWDLLSRRPAILGVASFQPPSDLLNSFESASIGSFGVFYERASQIEVMHSVAEFVTCGSPTAKHPTLVTNAFVERYGYLTGEVVVRSTLVPLLEALIQHRVGAPLLSHVSAHQWLVGYARSKVAASGQTIPADFFDGYDTPRILDLASVNDGMSVLLVDAAPA